MAAAFVFDDFEAPNAVESTSAQGDQMGTTMAESFEELVEEALKVMEPFYLANPGRASSHELCESLIQVYGARFSDRFMSSAPMLLMTHPQVKSMVNKWSDSAHTDPNKKEEHRAEVLYVLGRLKLTTLLPLVGFQASEAAKEATSSADFVAKFNADPKAVESLRNSISATILNAPKEANKNAGDKKKVKDGEE